jgi:hypothetical protein
MNNKLKEEDELYIEINKYYIETYLNKTYGYITEKDKEYDDITEYSCNFCDHYCRYCKICKQYLCIYCEDKGFNTYPNDTNENMCSYCVIFPIRLFLNKNMSKIISNYAQDCGYDGCDNLLCDYCKYKIKTVCVYLHKSDKYEICVNCKKEINNCYKIIMDNLISFTKGYCCINCCDETLLKIEKKRNKFEIDDDDRDYSDYSDCESDDYDLI